MQCLRTYGVCTAAFIRQQHIFSYVEKRRKRTIYIDQEIDKKMRVAAVEDDKFYGG